ncbi:MAG: hypothetical protein KDM63_16620, partial [Verrucomicrobiae bacterium]|nr:hypothetical protein [Verrucomicrobiae bacterium]
FDPATLQKVVYRGVVFQAQGLAAGQFVSGAASGAIRILPGTDFDYPGSEDAGALDRVEAPLTLAAPPSVEGVDPFDPTAAGLYRGTLRLAADVSGALENVVLLKGGGVSGVLWIEGVRRGFRGRFGDNGELAITITRPGGAVNDIILSLILQRVVGADADGFRLGGTITADGKSFVVNAQKHPAYSKTNRAPQAGKYTVALAAPEGVDTALEPAGDGYGPLTISFLGNASGLFVLPDGTRTSFAGHLGVPYDDGISTVAEWSLHRGLYGKVPKGYLAGKLFFRDLADGWQPDGFLHWVKQPGASAKVYPAGFDLTRRLVGAPYLPPAAGERAMSGLADEFHNLWLRFSGPDLSALDSLDLFEIDRVATWPTSNRLRYFGPEAVMIRFDPRNGLLTGSYVDSANGVRISYGGALLQTQSRVAGAFLSQGEGGLFVAQPR